MKKQGKKRKLKKGRLLLFLIIISLIIYLAIKFLNPRINSITIKGNDILTDQEIIELANLEDYPSFFGTVSFNIKKKLLKNDYIKSVRVRKGILSITITIKEEKILYIKSSTGDKVSLNKQIKDDKIVCVPYLISDITNTKEFNKAMNTISKDLLCQISEIKYDPNDIDSDRYYLYMNDGNSVYLTLNKFSKINKYNTILENVGKQNGTLYLDYGDYFQVK